MKLHKLLTLLCLIGASSMLAAADLVSGPPVGTKLTTVACYANSGPFAGRESFDAAKEIGDGPGAFLFIHVLDRNTAPVIRGFDNLAAELSLFGFQGFAVMLDADRTTGEEAMKRINGALHLRRPMVLSLDGLEGPGDLALNRRCNLSLVVVSLGRTTQSFGFTDTGLHDLDKIRKSFEDAIGEIPTKAAELLALAKDNLPADEAALRELAARQAVALYRLNKKASMDHQNSRRYADRGKNMRSRERPQAGKSMARDGRPQAKAAERATPKENAAKPKPTRRGGPPTDPKLNTLLRSYIRKTNGDERVDEVLASIQKRSKESEDLEKQTIAMFQLMLSFPDRYGSEHAQKLAKEFLAERGEK